jgi:hypothetical protein
MAHAKNPERKSGLKAKLRLLLTAGAGSVIVATTVAVAPATALVKPTAESVAQRAAHARAKLETGSPIADRETTPALELAWWRNWGNGGWHPNWHNWPNWRNWHNWGNW